MRTKFYNNSLIININYELKDDQNLIVIINNKENDIYALYGLYKNKLSSDFYSIVEYVFNENCDFYIVYDSKKVFKYNIDIYLQDKENIIHLENKIFNIEDHNFYFDLKSDNNKEIKIWKNYIELLKSTLNLKTTSKKDEFCDICNISKDDYLLYLKETEKPLNNSNSSIDIIKKIFDVE